MVMHLALLPAIMLGEIIVPAGPQRHADAIRTLAETHAVVLVASKRCAGLFASEEVNGLQAALGLSNEDSAEAYSVLLQRAREMDADAGRVGDRVWCNGIYDRFGPDGTQMKGLLKRCDPHATSC